MSKPAAPTDSARRALGFMGVAETEALGARGILVLDPCSTLVSPGALLADGMVLWPNVSVQVMAGGAVSIGADTILLPGTRVLASSGIVRIGEGLLARTLPRADWTHEAHLAATTYLLLKRPDVDLDTELPGIIRRYNESVGGVNDDKQGYHDTITRVFLRGIRLFLTEADAKAPLSDLVNDLLLSPMGRRDWPLRFYSAERLFSVEARRDFIPSDIAALP